MKSIVVHSGGMDSSLCLFLTKEKYGSENVISLTFDYKQRHSIEIERAKKISDDWGIKNILIPINFMQIITSDSLVDKNKAILQDGDEPNTLVVGRNGLMARIAAIFANKLNANEIVLGVLEQENSNYRDCSRGYFDLLEQILRIDLNNNNFIIDTPIVNMNKIDTLQLADSLNILDYLLENTVTCYEGLLGEGCKVCPSCILKNNALEKFKLLKNNS